MSHALPNNQSRIAGYLDTLLVDHSSWNEKLAQATQKPFEDEVYPEDTIYPQDTIETGHYVLSTNAFGSGDKIQKHLHLLNGLSLLHSLPKSRLKTTILHTCLPLAAEALFSE